MAIEFKTQPTPFTKEQLLAAVAEQRRAPGARPRPPKLIVKRPPGRPRGATSTPRTPAQIAAASKYHYEYTQKLKTLVFTKHGNRCGNPRCLVPGGCIDVRCLQIDPVNDDGRAEKLSGQAIGGAAYYNRVLRDTEGRYQLLCANCNWIKRAETDERRRQKRAAGRQERAVE